MKLLVLVLLPFALGCAMTLGVQKIETASEDPVQECKGLSIAFGNAKACGAEGGTISLPGVQVFGVVTCMAGTVLRGGSPLDCFGLPKATSSAAPDSPE